MLLSLILNKNTHKNDSSKPSPNFQKSISLNPSYVKNHPHSADLKRNFQHLL